MAAVVLGWGLQALKVKHLETFHPPRCKPRDHAAGARRAPVLVRKSFCKTAPPPDFSHPLPSLSATSGAHGLGGGTWGKPGCPAAKLWELESQGGEEGPTVIEGEPDLPSPQSSPPPRRVGETGMVGELC